MNYGVTVIDSRTSKPALPEQPDRGRIASFFKVGHDGAIVRLLCARGDKSAHAHPWAPAFRAADPSGRSSPADQFRSHRRASQRIEEMAKRMLDFSKKQTAVRTLRIWRKFISDALRFVQPYVRSQMIDVQVQLEPDLPLSARPLADGSGNREPFAECCRCHGWGTGGFLSITRRVEPATLRIAISDTGTGIPTNIARIFEPFFTTKGERGTGLGLYITKQVIEEHRRNDRRPDR